jgi:hypothetical protein
MDVSSASRPIRLKGEPAGPGGVRMPPSAGCCRLEISSGSVQQEGKMKSLLFGRRTSFSFICLVMLVAANASFAQPAGHNVALTTLIKSREGEKEKTTAFEQKNEKAIDTITESKSYTYTLTTTLKNAGLQKENVQLEWYFLTENLKGWAKGGKPEVPVIGVFEAGKKKVSLDIGAKVTESFESKPLVQTKITVDTLDENTGYQNIKIRHKGDTYLGYIVLVTVDGEIIAKDASSYRYLKDEWVEMCRSYKPKKGGRK